MALEERTVWAMRCDWCRAPGPYSPSSLAVVSEAIVCGWETLHEVAACPVCVERGANAEQPPDLLAACPMPAGVRLALGEGSR